MISSTEILLIALSSFGFMISITALLSGQQFTKYEASQRQSTAHKVIGYILLIVYIAVAFISISSNPKIWIIILWLLGLLFFYIKIRFVRSKKGYKKYASRLGIILFNIWLTIFIINVVLF